MAKPTGFESAKNHSRRRGRSLGAGEDSLSKQVLTTVRLPLLFAGLYLAQGTLLRLILWGAFGPEAGVRFGALPGILGLGLMRDLAAASILMLPLLIFSLMAPRRLIAGRLGRGLIALLAFASLFGLVYLGVMEYFYFEEFSSRFDIVSVDYLLYPHEVFINIWDSYPVLPVVLAVALLSAVLCVRLWPTIGGILDELSNYRRARGSLAAFGGACFLVVLPGGGSLEALPNRVANQISENGLRTFVLALRTSEIQYGAHYRSGDPERLHQRLLASLDPDGQRTVAGDGQEQSLRRRFEPQPGVPARTPNVVLVLEESFGAEFVGAYGDSRGLTPEFDALAEKGLLFRHAYSTGTRTVRGIEAVLTSFPPIPTVSIVKRPGSEKIANLGKTLGEQGYRNVFLYGGYGYFDNMSHFFGSNGFEIRDRSTLPEPRFANIWGVSDEDLFTGSLETFDAVHETGQPFFGVILTTSNHKPFTFPDGIDGVPAEGGGRLAGVRYADHALGRFVAEAVEHPWADNTIFVIVADHGARVYGAAQIPLHSYEIPLLFLWPGTLEPGVFEGLVSQIDIAPTLLGLLGHPYEAPFFGRDVLNDDLREPLLPFNHNHDVALLRDDKMVILGLQQRVDAVHYDRTERIFERIEADPDSVELTTAMYQIADAHFHNHTYQ